jgi:hypothetical protein
MVGANKSPEIRFAKTKICKFHLQGKCAKGSNCSFAHGGDEMEHAPDLYRTQLCMALMKTGKCKDSETCKYAHTREQLRALPQGVTLPEKPGPDTAKGQYMPQRVPRNKENNGKSNSDRHAAQQTPQTRVPPPPATPPSMWVVPVVYPVGGGPFLMANGYDSPIAGAFVMQGGYGLPFDRFPPSPQSGPKKLQHQVNCQKFFQKFHLPEAAVKKRQANTKKIEAEAPEAEASKCIDNVSNASTDHGSADSDKFALDGDSLDSFKSSLDSFKSSHADDAGIRHADDARILNQGVDQGFSVSIKNTFLDVSPKSMKKTQTGRVSKSVPPPNEIERFVHTTHGVN